MTTLLIVMTSLSCTSKVNQMDFLSDPLKLNTTEFLSIATPKNKQTTRDTYYEYLEFVKNF